MMRSNQSEPYRDRLAQAGRIGKPNPNRERYAAIGQELRRVYDTVVNEPVPPEMLALFGGDTGEAEDGIGPSEASRS